MTTTCLLLLALAPSTPVEAPVTSVTVYSDRARVTRTASVTLSGRQRVELPLLIEGVDLSSIRIEAKNADVETVDIARADADELPIGEARELLAAMEKLDDQLAQARRDRQIYAEMDVSTRLSPVAPTGDPLKAPPRLNAGGWGAVINFARTWSDKMQGKVRDLDEKLVEMMRKREGLAEKARILGGVGRRSGTRVTPTLSGKGGATITFSYMVTRARWRPTYDIQLKPDKGQVEILFAGMVSQESGEDWTDAAMTLSTSVPATSAEFPKLTSWKIGERERFIPTPFAQPEYPRPAPPAPPLLPPEPPVAEGLRQALLARAQGVAPMMGGEIGGVVRGVVGGMKADRVSKEYDREQSAPEPSPVYEPPPPPPPPAPYSRSRSSAPQPSRSAAPSAAPAMAEMEMAPSEAPSSRSDEGYSVAQKSNRQPSIPAQSIGIAPPPAYRAPQIAADLPAALAGGYDLSFPSAAKETVRSGKGARRVALFARNWPVSVERKVFPALAPEAFLVAEIKNPSAQALPGGQANLFVGADPAGVATLKVVAPGEAFTLPLGIDRAVKPIRNVTTTQAEKGLISKDEVSQYVVTTELANPYRAPLTVRIIDQMPVTDDKDLEVKLIRTEPPAKLTDPVKGQIEWWLTIPASGKTTVKLIYTLKRPKGYRLHQ